jgi:hypothetical protein
LEIVALSGIAPFIICMSHALVAATDLYIINKILIKRQGHYRPCRFIKLTAEGKAAIAAFLKTLNDE